MMMIIMKSGLLLHPSHVAWVTDYVGKRKGDVHFK